MIDSHVAHVMHQPVIVLKIVAVMIIAKIAWDSQLSDGLAARIVGYFFIQLENVPERLSVTLILPTTSLCVRSHMPAYYFFDAPSTVTVRDDAGTATISATAAISCEVMPFG